MSATRFAQNLCLFFGLLVSVPGSAQVFTHKDNAEHFEAVVTPGRLVVKERYQGASTIYGDLSCPLGPAVRATVLPFAGDGKLCLAFSKEKCGYTRFQNGNAIHKEELAGVDRPRMCIALSNAEEARRLASLVNAGPQPSDSPAPPPRTVASGKATPPPAPQTPTPAPVARRSSDVPLESAAPAKKPQTAPAMTAASSQAAKAKTDFPVAPAHASAAATSKPEPRITLVNPESLPRQVVLAMPAPGVGASSTPQRGDSLGGRWNTSWFPIRLGGNPRLTERIYATASIVDETGAARAPGGHLYIRNESDKYPLYYGLRNAATNKLEPGEEVTLPLTGQTPRQTVTQQTVVFRWYDEIVAETARRKDETAVRPAAVEAQPVVADASPVAKRADRETAGHWTTSWFTIRLGGNPRLAERTYASASIVDDTGAARAPGGHLFIRNESDRHPLYYGFTRGATDKLEPGAEVTLPLRRAESAPQTPITQRPVFLRWYDETAESARLSRAR
ncbi:MAG: hypothetical protein ACXWUK_00420 [Burkholderiales bacterium]